MAFTAVSPVFASDFTVSNVSFTPAEYPNAEFSFDYAGISPDMDNENSIIALYDTLNSEISVGYGYYTLQNVCSDGNCNVTFNGEGGTYPYTSGHTFHVYLNYGDGDKWSQNFILGEAPTPTATPAPALTYPINSSLSAGFVELFTDMYGGAITIIGAAIALIGTYWLSIKLVKLFIRWINKFSHK